jgi:hypothetical protein
MFNGLFGGRAFFVFALDGDDDFGTGREWLLFLETHRADSEKREKREYQKGNA